MSRLRITGTSNGRHVVLRMREDGTEDWVATFDRLDQAERFVFAEHQHEVHETDMAS